MINIHCGISTFLLLLLSYTGLDAQYAEPDSVYTGRKNTIMVLANPLLQTALQSNSNAALFGVTYKRMLHPAKRLKLGAGIELINLSPTNQEINVRHIHASTDSSVSLIEEQDYYQRTHIRGGLEWGDFTSKHGMYYGLDLQAGLRKENISSYIYHYKKMPVDSALTTETYFSTPADSTQGIFDYTDSYFDMGLALNIGYRIQLKEKWEINLIFSPEFNFYFATNHRWNLDKPEPLQYLPTNGFELQLRLLMVDIGYRF